MVARKINCLKCKYFYVTWDPKFPNGCKFFGFKSKCRPSLAVRQSSGQDCHGFEEKETVVREDNEDKA